MLGPSEAVRDSENLKCQLSLNRDLTIQEIEWVGVSLPSSAILDLDNHSALYRSLVVRESSSYPSDLDQAQRG